MTQTTGTETGSRPTQKTLFDDRAAVTLREAFEKYHQSAIHQKSTVQDYGSMLNTWERLTENPLLSQIDNLTLRDFRESMLTSIPPGRKKPNSQTTVGKNLRYVQAILATCGPQQHGNPEGLGILDKIPVCGKPPVNDPPVITAEDSEICEIYKACEVATWPRRAVDKDRGCCVIYDDPALFWRTLLVYLYNVGSRLGEFLTLRCDQIDMSRKRLLINPEKNGDRDYKPIHPILFDHIKVFLQPQRTYLFACPNNLTYLRNTFYAIQDAAGISLVRPKGSARKPYYGFHEIRKTCGTNIAALSIVAAQHQLGHKSMNTTRRYYVQGSKAVEKISDQITQPAAFSGQLPEPPEPPRTDSGRPQLRIVG